MPVNTKIEIVGVKNAINGLRKIDPQLQKDFKNQATQIAQPAVDAAKNVYSKFSTKLPLSGMKYKWQEQGRTRANFPFTVAKAVNGVKVRFDTRRNAVGVILIEQKDPAAAIFETAGRANANKLNTSLLFVNLPVSPGRTRLIGPAVYKARRGIEAEMEKMIKDTIRTVQKEL
jgi:hypothetical protein